MDVTIYIDGNWKFGSTPGAEDKDKVTFAEFMESGNITEKDNYIWATTENGTLTSYGFMV